MRRAVTGIVLSILALGVLPAQAQSLRNADQPAEFPPASYSAAQYIDSRGCVYVRAGFAGQVNWIPRVNRKRNHICGMKPSLASTRTAAAPAAAAPTPAPRTAAAAPAPQTKSTAKPKRTARVAAPKRPRSSSRVGAPIRTVASTTTAPRIGRQAISRPAAAAQPRTSVATTTVRTAPAPQPVRVSTPRTVTTVAASCAGRSAISQRYTNPGARCGPQAESPVGGAARGGTVTYSTDVVATASPRGGQRQGKVAQLLDRRPSVLRIEGAEPGVPAGYKPIFTDGRYNPDRGLPSYQVATVSTRQPTESAPRTRTASPTRVAWTASAPRRLIDLNTGQDVTAAYPGLRYPNTNLRGQRRVAIAAPTTTRQVVVVGAERQNATSTRARLPKATTNPTRKATKAAPAKVATKKPAASKGFKYVQVGTYGVQTNARNASSKLKTIGLPTRVAKIERKGQAFQIVLAGPFKSDASVQKALRAARGAGFSDAFPRR
jgi:hypothetical protein